ncbi:MAG TPA: AraC family transcriptional regulator [Chitinophagaceae bacterium]|jgi:AraC-like DNA-binding protein
MKIALHHYQRIVSAKRFMDQNFHESINLETVSRQAYLSRFHFHRLFTRIYQRTPHQYITHKRLEKAKELLTHDDKTVMEVCNEVGFESLGSFSTLFKKEIGFAPQYYRNMAWLKKKQAKEQPRAFIPHCFIEMLGLDQ